MPPSKPHKHIQDARKALYRDAIFTAAEAEFADQGYESTKVQAIASRAGVSLATLYSVFRTKWALLCELHERRLAELMTRIMSRIQDAPDELTRLRWGVETYLLFHIEHPDYLRMHLREGTAWAVNDELATPVQTQTWQAGLAMLVEACRAGIERGILLDEDPELMARTAIAMHQVRLALWVKRGMETKAEEVARHAERLFIRMFCRPSHRAALLEES